MVSQRISPAIRRQIFDDMNGVLDRELHIEDPSLPQREYGYERAAAFSSLIWRQFAKPRLDGDRIVCLQPVYGGTYIIDPKKPGFTRSFPFTAIPAVMYEFITRGFQHFTADPEKVGQRIEIELEAFDKLDLSNFNRVGACSPLTLLGGLIAKAFRTGENQYKPNVDELPPEEHIACDSGMHGGEYVLLHWGKPYTTESLKAIQSNGEGDIERLAGKRVPVAAVDIDLRVPGALTKRDFPRMKQIFRREMDLIFQDPYLSYEGRGQALFLPTKELAVR